MKHLTIVLTILLSLGLQARITNKAIHGHDDRYEAYSYKNPLFVQLAHSVAGKVPKKLIVRSLFHKGEYTFKKQTLKKGRQLCKDDRFSNQLILPNCTGFLVTPDTLITAGHCVRRKGACRNNYWVFDYTNKTRRIKKENLYRCKKIITQSYDPKEFEDDYAIVKLERKVSNRTPLQVDLSGNVKPGDKMIIIGHPTRLPLKITDNGKVSSVMARYFRGNLDIFEGNSGSPVFNAQTGKVIGLAVRAIHGYKKKGRCYQKVTLPENENDNVILKLEEIDPIRNFLLGNQ